MDTNNIVPDALGNCVVNNDTLKLEFIGKHFESVHRTAIFQFNAAKQADHLQSNTDLN